MYIYKWNYTFNFFFFFFETYKRYGNFIPICTVANI